MLDIFFIVYLAIWEQKHNYPYIYTDAHTLPQLHTSVHHFKTSEHLLSIFFLAMCVHLLTTNSAWHLPPTHMHIHIPLSNYFARQSHMSTLTHTHNRCHRWASRFCQLIAGKSFCAVCVQGPSLKSIHQCFSSLRVPLGSTAPPSHCALSHWKPSRRE